MRDRKNVMKNNILTGPLFFIGNDKNRRKTGKSPVARRRTPCYDERRQREDRDIAQGRMR